MKFFYIKAHNAASSDQTDKQMRHKQSGFTIIELLVVMSIIGLVSSMIMASVNSIRSIVRDTRRLSDMKQIRLALELYRDLNGVFPSASIDTCCDGWDQGPCNGNNTFIQGLETAELMTDVPVDPSTFSGTGCYGYNYFRYNAGTFGCDPTFGGFYVLAVRDMETSEHPHPDSPGWSCSGFDFQPGFDWVAGGFEN